MRIVTNPGSNLSDSAIQRYDVVVTPQQLVVDGVAHDTRERVPVEQIDRWVRQSKEFPYLVGTTAQEFAGIYVRLLQDDRELLTVMTSKKLIQSYTAAITASRSVLATPRHKNADIAVVDTTITDAGTGLMAILAGEAARADLGLRRTVELLETLAQRARFVFTVDSVDYMVRGGRASWLRGWLANLLNVKPVIAFVDGELKGVSRISGNEDPVEALTRDVAKTFAGRKVWISTLHGAVPEKARELAASVARHLDVQYVYQRELSPGVYAYSGQGALGLAVVPIDDLGWTPPIPPDLSDE